MGPSSPPAAPSCCHEALQELSGSSTSGVKVVESKNDSEDEDVTNPRSHLTAPAAPVVDSTSTPTAPSDSSLLPAQWPASLLAQLWSLHGSAEVRGELPLLSGLRTAAFSSGLVPLTALLRPTAGAMTFWLEKAGGCPSTGREEGGLHAGREGFEYGPGSEIRFRS
eukprot:jgi/Mesen1/8059/ME000432S07351